MTTTECLLLILIGVTLWNGIQLRELLRRLPIAFLFFDSPANAQQKTMASEVEAAVVDAEKLPAEIARYTRYFSLACSSWSDAKDQADAVAILTFHLWSLAHEPDPPKLRQVSPTLYAINLPEFGIDPYIYGRLTFLDPYNHAGLTSDGRREEARAQGLNLGEPKTVKRLVELTHSQVPLLRADWFFQQTFRQQDRGNAGYYDFLAIKSRTDFFKLIGFDPKLADATYKRSRLAVQNSGVAQFSRQIERAGSLDGGFWFTLDVIADGKGRKNAIRNLDTKEFQHDAEELYGIGPSGLPVYFLSNANGDAQNTAPDGVGPDKTAFGNDTRIHVCSSCIRCHTEILRPIDSWVAKALKNPAKAEIPVEKYLETKRLYFRDLSVKLEQDRLSFSTRLFQCNGLLPAANSKAYIRLSDKYAADVSLEQAAIELGVSAARWKTVLTAVQSQGKLEPVFSDWLSVPPGKVTRLSWEETVNLAQIYVGGDFIPKGKP